MQRILFFSLMFLLGILGLIQTASAQGQQLMVCAAMDSKLNRQREMSSGRSGFGASLTCHDIC